MVRKRVTLILYYLITFEEEQYSRAMTLVDRFLVERKQAMSAMMPSDTITMLSYSKYTHLCLVIELTQLLVQSKKPFLTLSICT